MNPIKWILALLLGGAFLSKRPTRPPRVGLWWDIGAHYTLSDLPRYLRELKEDGINDLAIMVQDSDASGWSMDWPYSALREFIGRTRAQGIRTGVTVWPTPTKEWVKGLQESADEIRSSGAQFLELDAEIYAKRIVRGYETKRAATADLVQVLRQIGLPVQLTTYPYGLEDVEDLIRALTDAGLLEGLAVQAYSQNDGDEEGREAYAWGGPLGPGGMQHTAARKMAEYAPGVPIIMGGAAYDQDFPEVTPEEAMLVGFHAGREYTPDSRHWSAKWVYGHPRRTPLAYTRRFFALIKES